MASTATKILDTAQELAQKRGFNAFSYADISKEIGIKTASIHYHFPSKTDLGMELVSRYRKIFGELLNEIDAKESNAFEKLRSYIDLYGGSLRDDRMCLCGMLASDITTLPKGIDGFVESFFRDNEKWLAKVLEEGRVKGTLNFEGEAAVQAQFLLSSVQGALLVSRAVKSESKFKMITKELLKNFTVGS